MQHELKSWPQIFSAMATGSKLFDYRKVDRPYAIQDTLHLREWQPITGTYTGREMRVKVMRIWTSGDIPGLPSDYVIMDIEPLDANFKAPAFAYLPNSFRAIAPVR